MLVEFVKFVELIESVDNAENVENDDDDDDDDGENSMPEREPGPMALQFSVATSAQAPVQDSESKPHAAAAGCDPIACGLLAGPGTVRPPCAAATLSSPPAASSTDGLDSPARPALPFWLQRAWPRCA